MLLRFPVRCCAVLRAWQLEVLHSLALWLRLAGVTQVLCWTAASQTTQGPTVWATSSLATPT